MGKDSRQLPRATRRWERAGKKVTAWLIWSRKAAPVRELLDLFKREATEPEQAILDAEPERDQQTAIIIACWQYLDSCRALGVRSVPLGGGQFFFQPFEGPIPWTAIKSWGETYGLGSAGISILAEAITYLDREKAKREASELRTRSGR